MTITKKPTRPKKPEENRDAIASAFIQAADHRAKAESGTPPKAAKKPKRAVVKKAADETVAQAAPTPELAPPSPTKEKKPKEKTKEKDKAKKKKHKKKEAVIIRFEDAQLAEIDSSAEALSLSRAAWVRMVVARALAKS